MTTIGKKSIKERKSSPEQRKGGGGQFPLSVTSKSQQKHYLFRFS